MSLPDQDDMTAMLTVFEPTCLLESPYGPLARNHGQRRHLNSDLDFTDFYRRRHPMGRSCRQTTGNRFADVVKSLGFRSTLRDATRNCRAFGYQHARFVRFQCDEELHDSILPPVTIRRLPPSSYGR